MGERFFKFIMRSFSPLILGIAAASIYWSSTSSDLMNMEQAAFGLLVMAATAWVIIDRSHPND